MLRLDIPSEDRRAEAKDKILDTRPQRVQYWAHDRDIRDGGLPVLADLVFLETYHRPDSPGRMYRYWDILCYYCSINYFHGHPSPRPSFLDLHGVKNGTQGEVCYNGCVPPRSSVSQ